MCDKKYPQITENDSVGAFKRAHCGFGDNATVPALQALIALPCLVCLASFWIDQKYFKTIPPLSWWILNTHAGNEEVRTLGAVVLMG
jgi:hypothetical protein